MALKVKLNEKHKNAIARSRKRKALVYEPSSDDVKYKSLIETETEAVAGRSRGNIEVIVSDGESDSETKPETKGVPKKIRVEGSKIDKIEKTRAETPFIKKLYDPAAVEVEDSDLAAFMREFNVKIENCDILPVRDWFSLNMPIAILNSLHKLQFDEPTPIQAVAIPIILSGRDVLGIAPTGSGKTLAFGLPLMRHILANKTAASNTGPQALVLAPTRELCIQIHKEISLFTENLGLHSLCCHGGSDIKQQVSKIVARKCDVIVATPGRLIDLLVINSGRVLTLNSVTFLVVDEIDRMCDLGFSPQVKSIVSAIREDRQSVLFSATINEHHIKLSESVLTTPAKVIINQNLVVKTIDQSAFLLSEKEKFAKLIGIFNTEFKIPNRSAIVFVEKQTKADSLVVELSAIGVKCMSLHGGMDQQDRSCTLSDFRNGVFPVLVATSVAARGIDVKKLHMVINYDAASHVEDYIHRAGRTGRAGEQGKCISFITPDQAQQAYDLSTLFTLPSEIASLAEKHGQRLNKEGSKISKLRGFGGFGLSKLEQIRSARKNIELEVFSSEHQSGQVSNPETDLGTGTSLKTGSNSFAGATAMAAMISVVTSRPGEYIVKLPINDVPKRARMAVTSPLKQAEITQNHQVSLTVKGEFRRPNDKRQGNGEKLHILIEGKSKESVTNAYAELSEILNKEEYKEDRYTVL